WPDYDHPRCRGALCSSARRSARLLQAWCRCGPVTVVTGPADTSQAAPSRDCVLALRQQGCHRLDDFVDAVTPRSTFARRVPSTCRKAARKKNDVGLLL